MFCSPSEQLSPSSQVPTSSIFRPPKQRDARFWTNFSRLWPHATLYVLWASPIVVVPEENPVRPPHHGKLQEPEQAWQFSDKSPSLKSLRFSTQFDPGSIIIYNGAQRLSTIVRMAGHSAREKRCAIVVRRDRARRYTVREACS